MGEDQSELMRWGKADLEEDSIRPLSYTKNFRDALGIKAGQTAEDARKDLFGNERREFLHLPEVGTGWAMETNDQGFAGAILGFLKKGAKKVKKVSGSSSSSSSRRIVHIGGGEIQIFR